MIPALAGRDRLLSSATSDLGPRSPLYRPRGPACGDTHCGESGDRARRDLTMDGLRTVSGCPSVLAAVSAAGFARASCVGGLCQPRCWSVSAPVSVCVSCTPGRCQQQYRSRYGTGGQLAKFSGSATDCYGSSHHYSVYLGQQPSWNTDP